MMAKVVSGILDVEYFAILDGQDRIVFHAPHIATLEKSNQFGYMISPRFPNRLIRLPSTEPVANAPPVASISPIIGVDFTKSTTSLLLSNSQIESFRLATWRLKWPQLRRVLGDEIGVFLSPIGDNRVESLRKYFGIRSDYLLEPELTFTFKVCSVKSGSLDAVISVRVPSYPPSFTGPTLRVTWAGDGNAKFLTVTLYIAVVLGLAEIDVQFVGYLRPGILELKTLCRWQILKVLISTIPADICDDTREFWRSLYWSLRRLPLPKDVRKRIVSESFQKSFTPMI